MKNNIQIKRYILLASLIALYILTVSIAFITHRYYGIITKGVLGVATMYLLFFFGRHSKIDISIDALVLSPNKGKYFGVAFAGGLVFFWATMQFLEMILFFLKR